MSSPFFAQIGVPTAGQCFHVLGPVGGLFLLNWILRHSDELIHRAFPNLEFDRKLGWLNIRSARRAAAFLRWLGYGVYALLAVALYGIVWGAVGLGFLPQWRDPSAWGEILNRVPVLVGSAGVWAVYLMANLVPKLRREFEEEELERYRAECAALEQAEEEHFGAARPKSPPKINPLAQKPRPRG